jgi:CubicO group peptidase (beta-lactamase class C family)
VAQLLVEGLLGEPFPRIMQELVLGPLGMAHSTYEQPLPRSFHRLAATAHPWKGDPLPGKWHVYPEMGAAGLWTTPTDLAKVGLEIQRAVRGESTFLPKALADEMLTRQMEDVGIGFFLDGKGGPIRFGHTGSNEGFMAKATFYKDLGKGAVIMVNSNEGNPLRAEIERAIAREYGWPEYFKPENPRVSLAPAALDRLGGDYETEDRIRLSVARSGESLTLTVGRQPPLPLVPSAPSKFFSPNLNLEVTFKLNGEGRAEGLVLQQEKLTLEAKRRP